jgi:ABC-type sugar transport system ATPase subunit
MKLNGVTKTFSLNGVTACDNINLALDKGETLVLMGENGAGKSSLAALMGGILSPDKGIVDYGKTGPAGIVHQKTFFCPDMSVLDTVFGGNPALVKGFFYSPKREKRRLLEIFQLIDSEINPESSMSELSPSQIQETELAENILSGKKIIIFDEPEFPRLEGIISLLKNMDITPILITHKIQQALDRGQRFVIMGKGRIILDKKRDEPGLKELIIKTLSPAEEKNILPPIGYSEKGIIRVIAGYHESGLFEEENRWVEKLASGDNGYIPSVNRQQAMEDNWSPVDNLMIHRRHGYPAFFGFLHKPRYLREGYASLNRYGIKTRPEDKMKHLSGGNQKKLLLVREFQRSGKRILLAEPSNALDLTNREFLYQLIFQAKEEGKEVIILTADPEEALFLGDEVSPLYKGKQIRTFFRNECSLPQLTALMGGDAL